MQRERPQPEHYSERPNETPEGQNDLELAREFFHKEDFQLNGQQVEIHGVYHKPATIEFHHKELEDAIKRAELVVVEMGPVTTDLSNALEKSDLNPVVKEEIRSYFDFYNYISELAGRQNKMIVNADPAESGEGEQFFRNLESFNEKDEDVQRVKTLVAAGLPAGLALTILRKKMGSAEEMRQTKVGEDTKEANQKLPKKMSRRLFILASLGAVAGGSLASVSKGADYFNRRTDRFAGRKDNPLGPFLYNLEDYRDLITSEALDKLTKKSIKGPVTVIYGDTHRSALRHYALSPRERAAKRNLYAAYENIMPPEMKVYKPAVDARSGILSWDKVKSEKL
ncbi:MAG: hypothetical protein HY396_02440 [Candidatus Doudnabacteria bacterium]|nr:hypothetical protein [Candidatus Doudnabacteria bacterium]